MTSDAEGAPIRAAEERDLPSIEAIVREAYARYLPLMDRPPGPMLADYGRLVREGTVSVIETTTGVAGLLVLHPQDGFLLLENVAVRPDLQGHGYGRRLMQWAEAEATRLRLPEIHLYTNAVMVENIALYTRMGFRELGRGDQDGYRRVFMHKRLI